jgi:hypothetical protein
MLSSRFQMSSTHFVYPGAPPCARPVTRYEIARFAEAEPCFRAAYLTHGRALQASRFFRVSDISGEPRKPVIFSTRMQK